ncbi:hypothetical protein F3J44_09570 [Pantoea sp. Tr-811]|uniref:DUF6708 domain-containing protein n=1 Tax=Pantoea sp. Tr-811 TaxID=2608361 RepID=UPI0014222CCE|nr:DUF6708 domain-containing protein [Pantoea sp. Tr-811]NIF26635.1 hypothetical protein [Pantoea sp. Tr-811]
MKTKTKRLPKSIRFGGTRLRHGVHQSTPPQPDGVRRINDRCVEIETYANLTLGGTAGFIGSTLLISPILSIFFTFFLGATPERLLGMIIAMPALPLLAVIFYFASGAHRCRGAFIRINRITRKIYFIHNKNPKHMHILDWNGIEGFAGFIPIFSSHGYTTRHPLYLIGIDHALDPPSEVFAACGNAGAITGDQSARSLWTYLQHFMANGPEDLPKPDVRPSNLSRREATLLPYKEWADDVRQQFRTPRDWILSPVTILIALFLLVFDAYPESFEAWLQYNVPHLKFPHQNDVLCGFAEKRKAIIRVNGVKVDQ